MDIKEIMDIKKIRLYSALTGIVYSIFLCAIYIYFRKLPFFDVFLDADRRRYFLVVYVLGFIGVFLYLIAKEKINILRIKIPLYGVSYFLFAGIPLIFFIVNGLSAKGWEWAFSTLLIGLFPVLFLVFGFLVLYGYPEFSMGLIVSFGASALFYIVMFVIQLGIFGAPPFPNKFMDILFALIIIGAAIFSIRLNLINLKTKHVEIHG
ncbi:MAG: hypothetical protein ACM3SY_05985 [Candidatus Omnitrophota bacterium]